MDDDGDFDAGLSQTAADARADGVAADPGSPAAAVGAAAAGTRPALEGNLARLRAEPALTVEIQGHCDERGTVDDNLALGERRANVAKQWLVSNGIAPSRIRTLSYGEERPADPGHDEAAWALNRRDEFQPFADPITSAR